MPKNWQSYDQKLDRIISMLNTLINKETKIMATLADIQSAVTAEKTVEDSVVTLLQSLSAQLAAAIASGNPAQVQAIVDQINTNAASLAAAVTANTPA